MQIPEDLGGRIRLALKVVNLSAGALGSAVGVDKSVVSRWLSGKVVPNSHNLSRVAAEIARRMPGFSVLTFEGSAEEFRRAIGLGEGSAPVPQGSGDSLPVAFGLLDAARKEIARRGIEYFGHYDMFYWAFSRKGRIARMELMLRPEGGLIEARYGAGEFEFRGWALLMLNRLYIQFAEERFEAMGFLVTNAGQQPRARLITGILLGPSEGMLVPAASPVVLVRTGEVTGDLAGDDAEYERRKVRDPLDDAATPDAIRAALSRDSGPRAFGEGGDMILKMPYIWPGD
ncbi:MAG: helix-turn-helix domain-containing protein [Paracoccaceae bacterium]